MKSPIGTIGMKRGNDGSLGWAGKGLLVAWLALLAGCAGNRPQLDRGLQQYRLSRVDPQEKLDQYRVGCPDVLAATVEGREDWQGRRLSIGVDGRVDLGGLGRLPVEGLTPAEIAGQVAGRLAVPPGQVRIGVAEFRSLKVYIFGEVNGQQRALDFRGDETVVELLQRAGGFTPGAELDKVFVIRANVADGSRPEVFPVKLHDIVLNNDNQTNLALEPGDQIVIGETRRSRFEKCVPPILRPVYDTLCGMVRAGRSLVSRPRTK